MVAVATTFSVTAAPLTAKKLKTAGGEALSVTAVAKAAPAKAPAAKKGRIMPKKRTVATASSNVFRSAAKTAAAPVKAPYKTPLQAAADVPTLYGSVTFADGWDSSNNAIGLYTVPTSASQNFELLAAGIDGSKGGVMVDGVYYYCQVEEFWGYVLGLEYKGYDLATGTEVFSNTEFPYYTENMTLDPTTGDVYAISTIEETLSLVKLSFDGQEMGFEPVAALEQGAMQLWNSIACDKNGQLYGIVVNYELVGEEYQPASSDLCKINKATGEVTVVGATGEIPVYITDSTIDPKSGRMFWTVCPSDETGWLCEVDLTTGAATRLYHFPLNQEVVGLAIPVPAAEDNAPAAVTEAKAVFNGGSLSGTVDFKAPTTLFDGTAATGALTYTILANGEQVATGSTTYGTNVSTPVTLDAAGLYTFVIYVANDKGSSPKTTVKNIYVGKDYPEATKVTAEYVDGNMNVSWLPVTASVNGGYLNADAVTYTVTRYPGAVEVAKDIKVTSFSEALAEPAEITTYYYTVVAKCEGMESQAAQSNLIILGSIVPPFTATFDDSLDGFTVIDANNDGKSWQNVDGRARISYNSNLDMDDWLITPPLKLEAGKLYDVAAEFASNSTTFPERVEVKVGKLADPSAMTTVLLEPTLLENSYSKDPMEWSTTFIPEADGTYFIGIHGISDADKYYLYVDNFSISAPKSAEGPAAATNLTVTPGDLGALTATVKFTTPDKALNGNTITSLTKAELLRNGTVINTWNNPAVATELTYNDNLPELGDYTYSVVCYNESGNGGTVEATAFIGVDFPAAPQNVHAFETATPGEVTITWDAVTTSKGGSALDASQVKYQVYKYEGGSRTAVSSEISATTYTYQAVEAGKQDFVQFAVFAITDRGEGLGNVSEFFAAGTPYPGMTFTKEEDFDNYVLGISSAGGGQWTYFGDDKFEGITSVDNDNFFLAMQGQYLDQYASLYTGLITLEGMVNPGLTFYTYNINLQDDAGNPAPDTNEIALGVKEKSQSDYTTVKTVVVSETGGFGWNKVTVDLSAYAGKVVQIDFTATVNAAAYTFIDNIKVGSLLDQDLKLASLTAPAKVNAGADYKVDVVVANEGVKTSGAYTVELYADTELADSKTGDALASGASATYSFDLSMSALATEPVTFFAKVVYAADENETNNQSDNVTVTPVVSKYPTVTDLAGVAQDNAVKLTWSEPNLDAAPSEPVTEDFEDAVGFTAEYGEWTFADLDGAKVGGFQNMEIPNITVGETTGSFWIWDHAMVGNDTFKAHSGEKYLFALFNLAETSAGTPAKNNDWAISPALDGSAQTISFYARSYSGNYAEAVAVYYSTGSTAAADFVKVEGAGSNAVPEEWTLYTADLPAGAMHFAIVCESFDSFMLMVDDVTYIPAGATTNLEIVGYNVYRDGVKINEATVEECEYVDANVEDGKTYNYVVTAVYNKGESAASNIVSVAASVSGLDSILAAGVAVKVVDRNIVITGAAGQAVAVYTVDGKTLYAGRGEAKTVVAAHQGVYVVKAGNTVKKVLVK